MDAINANATLRRRFPNRPSSWREALARKQSRVLSKFLRETSSSNEETTLQDSGKEVLHIEATLSHDDLLYQILMLLPAESLFRLQFVCKQWFSLINSPNFVTSHAKKVETVLISQQLTFSPQGPKGKSKPYFHFLNLDSWGSDFVESSVSEMASVRASYNGLILACGGKRKRWMLMNPITRNYIELPLGVASHPLCESFGIAWCGEAKTYKIVHLFREVLGSIGSEILSINSRINSREYWRRIEGPSELLRIRQTPVSVGGSLHWLSSKRGRDSFVSMNVHDERFVSKKLPVKRGGNDRLVEIGGSLGFVTHLEVNVLQVWIFIDGWNKRYSIGLEAGFDRCVPICSQRNGEEMVLECVGGHLYAYNFDREETRMVNSRCEEEPWFGKVNKLYIPHWNTLVSCGNRSPITL